MAQQSSKPQQAQQATQQAAQGQQAQPQAQPQQTPQQAAQARLLACLAQQGSAGPQAINLARLQAGRAYSLRELASAVGFTPRTRSNGKQVYGPLRRALRQAVANGKLVTATTGGYTTANGTTAGGKAYYMLID